MKLIAMSLEDFSKAVDSDAPSPGGGSVAAYVNNLGVALLRMLGHLTIKQKKFAELDEDIKSAYLKSFNELEYIYKKLLLSVDEDKEVFDKVMDAYRIDKKDEKRHEAIQKATLEAAQPPLEVAQLAYQALEISVTLVDYANNQAISDLIGGMYLLEAGLNCALLNVKINAKALDDKAVRDDLLDQAKKLQIAAREVMDLYTEKIEQDRL